MPGPTDLNHDGKISQYEQDLYDWQQRKANGPFPGPAPWPSKDEQASIKMANAGMPSSIPNASYWDAIFRAGANAPMRDNPYSMIIANQTRPAQQALLAQMQAQAAGPSVAGTQAQMALGQNATQALGAMGRGPLAARAALAQQAGIGGGIAGDAASARLQEGMNQQRGMFGLASGMRGNDIRAAQDQAQSGLAIRGLDDAARRFYAGQGSNFAQMQDRAYVEWIKAQQMIKQQMEQRQQAGVQKGASLVAPVVGGMS